MSRESFFCFWNENTLLCLGTLFGDSHSRRQIAPTTTPAASLNHSTSIQQAQQAQQQQQQSHIQQQQQQQQQASSSSTTPNVISVNTTNAWLSRAFGILLRQITDLLIRWPNTLSATSLYHDVLTTATTIDEQNTLDTIQVNQREISDWFLFSSWCLEWNWSMSVGQLAVVRHCDGLIRIATTFWHDAQ